MKKLLLKIFIVLIACQMLTACTFTSDLWKDETVVLKEAVKCAATSAKGKKLIIVAEHHSYEVTTNQDVLMKHFEDKTFPTRVCMPHSKITVNTDGNFSGRICFHASPMNDDEEYLKYLKSNHFKKGKKGTWTRYVDISGTTNVKMNVDALKISPATDIEGLKGTINVHKKTSIPLAAKIALTPFCFVADVVVISFTILVIHS